MYENHDHCAHSYTSNKVVLRNSFLMISAFMLIEVAGGFATNSLALLSDAGHMLSDCLRLNSANAKATYKRPSVTGGSKF